MLQPKAPARIKVDAAAARPDPARAIADLPGFDYAGHALLREVRWRRHEWDRRGISMVLVAIVLLHVVGALIVRELMHVHLAPEDRSDVMHISLIDEPLPELPAVPALVLPPLRVQAPPIGSAANAPAPQRPAAAVRQVAPAAAQAGTVDAIVSTPQLPKLYNADGSLRLVPQVQSTAAAGPMADGKEAARELLTRGHNLVRCRPTRFSSIYSPDESAGDEVARKYLAVVGLYNPHSAASTAQRGAEANSACDSDGF